MSILYSVVGAIFDALFAPFAGLPASVTLVPISLAFTVFALLVVKWTSNQDAVNRAKDQWQSGIFEIRLFNDDIGAIFRAMAHVFWNVGKQLGLMVVPLLWMLVPFAILIPQMEIQYGYSGLEAGQSVLLKVTLDGAGDPTAPSPGLRLETPSGIDVETPAIWVPARDEVLWRVSASAAGDYELKIVSAGGETTTKTLVSSDGIVRRSPYRTTGFWTQLLFPGEAPLPSDGSVREVSLPYPGRTVNLLGLELHWLIHFLILTVILAFALRGPMNVTF